MPNIVISATGWGREKLTSLSVCRRPKGRAVGSSGSRIQIQPGLNFPDEWGWPGSCVDDVDLALRPRKSNVEQAARFPLITRASIVAWDAAVIHAEQHDHPKFAALGAVQG